MKYYILSHITRLLLGALRKYHREYEKLLVFSNDFIGEEVFSYGVYEKNEIDTLVNVLDFEISDKVILDIGANIGNHAVQFSKYFSKVICFEPNKLIFDILKINTREKNNIQHHNIGLSETDFEGFLRVPKDNFGGAYVTHESGNKTIAITLKRGDDIIQDDFSVIKIDIEGHEIKALNGMKKLIEKNKPIIYFELINREKSDLAIIELLKNMGYTNFYIPYRKSIFPKSKRKSFFRSFIDGLIFKNKHQLIEINKFNSIFYNMILCEHAGSNNKLKRQMIKK